MSFGARKGKEIYTAGRGRSPIQSDMAAPLDSVSKLRERRFRWLEEPEVGLGLSLSLSLSLSTKSTDTPWCTSVQRSFALIGGQENSLALIGYPRPCVLVPSTACWQGGTRRTELPSRLAGFRWLNGNHDEPGQNPTIDEEGVALSDRGKRQTRVREKRHSETKISN